MSSSFFFVLFLVWLYVRVPSLSFSFFLSFFHSFLYVCCFFFPLPFKKHENVNENASEGWIRRQFLFSFFSFFCNQRKSFFPCLLFVGSMNYVDELWELALLSLCLSSLEQQDQIHIWFICLFVEHIAWLSEGCFLKLYKKVFFFFSLLT